MKSKFSKTLDFILTRAAIFAVCFVWARYHIENVWVSLFASFIITVTVNVILALILGFKNRGKSLRASEQAHLKEVSNQFLLSDMKQNIDFFAKAFGGNEECEITVMHNCLTASKDGRAVAVFPHFSPSALTRHDVIEYVRFATEIQAREIAIMCLSTEKGLSGFCESLSDFNIKIYDPVKTYALLKSYKCFPEITRRMARAKKPTLKSIIRTAIVKTRTKAYVMAGLFLLGFSYVTPYRLYYLIGASVLFFVALVSQFNRKYNSSISKNMKII